MGGKQLCPEFYILNRILSLGLYLDCIGWTDARLVDKVKSSADIQQLIFNCLKPSNIIPVFGLIQQEFSHDILHDSWEVSVHLLYVAFQQNEQSVLLSHFNCENIITVQKCFISPFTVFGFAADDGETPAYLYLSTVAWRWTISVFYSSRPVVRLKYIYS